jgi:hypothetical protein
VSGPQLPWRDEVEERRRAEQVADITARSCVEADEWKPREDREPGSTSHRWLPEQATCVGEAPWSWLEGEAS